MAGHLTMLADTATGTLTGTANTGLGVFNSWIFTPTGATLTLMLIVFGVLAAIRKGSRWVTVTMRIVLVMWLTWVLGGILQAWGVPVRETISLVGGWLPGLLNGILQWFGALFRVA
jgi:hypothetical protein